MSDKGQKFYLGKVFDPKKNALTDETISYDPKDLTTHGVIVGMTGSGKTGLSIGILEEAALLGIPSIVIDPKAEMANLLLAFPDCAPGDFLPWVDPAQAAEKGLSVEDMAKETALSWKKGLSEWGIDAERIRRYKESCDFVVYTPGSSASVPLNVLSSFKVPRDEKSGDEEEVLELISGSVSALLALVGIEADPLTSREHILLCKIIEDSWNREQDINLEKIITFIQDPPMKRVGVFGVEEFFPRPERQKLAMALNNIIASPTFEAWRKGPTLSMDMFLKPRGEKPGVSIFYLSHLSEAERHFFLTMLFWKVIIWMRKREGSAALRLLIYIDEALGLLPPYPFEPPTKKPIITLLKQARAYGIGLLIATQNPVDIDYKALTNAGTWFVGRLQTKRDKERLLEGLTYASKGGPPPGELDDLISGLESRVFLLHNVHENTITHMKSRWAMSYLCGPLSKNRLKDLPGRCVPTEKGGPGTEEPKGKDGPTQTLLRLPPEVGSRNFYLSPGDPAYPAFARLAPLENTADAVGMRFVPAVLGRAEAKFDVEGKGVAHTQAVIKALFPLADQKIWWKDAIAIPSSITLMQTSPVGEEKIGGYQTLPEWCSDAGEIKKLSDEFLDYMKGSARLKLFKNPHLDIFSELGETRENFVKRLADIAEERSSGEVEKITKRYKDKIEGIEKKLRKEERDISIHEMEYEERKREELVSAGETVLSLVFGRRRSRGLSGAITKRRMTQKAKGMLEAKEGEIDDFKLEMENLEKEMEREVAAIEKEMEAKIGEIEEVEIALEKNDLSLLDFGILWVPV